MDVLSPELLIYLALTTFAAYAVYGLTGFGNVAIALPVMLFFRSYRKPQFYISALQAAGFRGVEVQTIRLDLPFMLISATK